MQKNVTAVVFACVTVLAVIGLILTVHHLQSGSKSSPTSEAVRKHQAPNPATDPEEDEPLTAYPEPRVYYLKNEPQLLRDGKPPETMGELEAVLGHHHGLLAGGASGVTLGNENSILRLQIIRPETGEVIKAEDRWEFSFQQLSLPESKPEFGLPDRWRYKVWRSFGSPSGSTLVFYFIIAKDYYDERYATCGGIIPHGVRYSLAGDTQGSKEDLYAEFTIPKDIEPGT